MNPPPFEVREPSAAPIPLVVSIPHTGTALPEDVAAALAGESMRALPMTDWHLHHLYDFLPALGATTIAATYSRFVVDLNRPPEPRAMYPGRFETGLVPTRTFQGEPVFATPPDEEQTAARRAAFHRPYHARLRELLDVTCSRFGRVCLVDAHSIASGANLVHGALEQDIYLGNRDGAASGAWLIDLLDGAFAAQGLAVARNDPYKGGYITDHYGGLDRVEAIQIEMCQRVYMAEEDPGGALAHPRFAHTKALLSRVFAQLAESLQ